MQALRLNGISFASFDQGKKQKDVVDQFLKDESISVFLLHAERERYVVFDEQAKLTFRLHIVVLA